MLALAAFQEHLQMAHGGVCEENGRHADVPVRLYFGSQMLSRQINSVIWGMRSSLVLVRKGGHRTSEDLPGENDELAFMLIQWNRCKMGPLECYQVIWRTWRLCVDLNNRWKDQCSISDKWLNAPNTIRASLQTCYLKFRYLQQANNTIRMKIRCRITLMKQRDWNSAFLFLQLSVDELPR